jgi:hypothetical protein
VLWTLILERAPLRFKGAMLTKEVGKQRNPASNLTVDFRFNIRVREVFLIRYERLEESSQTDLNQLTGRMIILS